MHLDRLRGIHWRDLWAFEGFSSGGSYWASSANPRRDICSFAVAGSNGISLLTEVLGVWDIPQRIPDPQMMALDWLTENVVIRARRRGAVKLWDIRTRAENAGSRIQHPYDIWHVRAIDENIIVVAGLFNTVGEFPYSSMLGETDSSALHVRPPLHQTRPRRPVF